MGTDSTGMLTTCTPTPASTVETGYLIDPGYRTRVGLCPYINETQTIIRAGGSRHSVCAMGTSQALPLIYETFSMQRYSMPPQHHAATTRDAALAADILSEEYAQAFAGHCVITPLQVLEAREVRVAGWLFAGSHRPGSCKILRTVKDTSRLTSWRLRWRSAKNFWLGP